MAPKFKLKRKKSLKVINVIIIITIIFALQAIGYSMFSTQLNINGIINIVGNSNPADDFPVVIIPPQDGSGEYVSVKTEAGSFNNITQEVDGDTIVVTMSTTTSNAKKRSITLNMEFKNSTQYTYTNCNANFNIVSESRTFLTTPTINLNPRTIEPNGTGTLTATFSNLNFKNLGESVGRFVVSFTKNGTNEEFYMNVVIRFNA